MITRRHGAQIFVTQTQRIVLQQVSFLQQVSLEYARILTAGIILLIRFVPAVEVAIAMPA